MNALHCLWPARKLGVLLARSLIDSSSPETIVATAELKECRKDEETR
jgi:hypothetical protein